MSLRSSPLFLMLRGRKSLGEKLWRFRGVFLVIGGFFLVFLLSRALFRCVLV